MHKNRIDIITMGCSKNLVDSEALMRLLSKKGYEVRHDPERPDGEIVVVNTCGFIGDAKEESVNMILELAEAKAAGRVGRLMVMGCLSERYLADLEKELPEVDRYYGKFNFRQLADDLPTVTPAAAQSQAVPTGTPRHYAYIKISEGCDRRCAYCAIPLITGRHKSRPIDEIVAEVRQRVTEGATEFNIIAQELTYYGLDLYGRRCLAELIDRIADTEGVRWVRLHYAYPNDFPWDVLEVMRRRENVCRYLDIALQHISDRMLSRMLRHTTKAETLSLIERIRREVPGIHLRTTLMVGFPGETDADFEELMDFVRTARFERMGAFAYSEEEGTYSAEHYADDVPAEVKQQRLDRLMRLQQRIAADVAEQKVGQELTIVVDRREGDYYVGRTEFSSPEVDPEVLVPATERQLRRGHYYKVRVTSADNFDLYATVVAAL